MSNRMGRSQATISDLTSNLLSDLVLAASAFINCTLSFWQSDLVQLAASLQDRSCRGWRKVRRWGKLASFQSLVWALYGEMERFRGSGRGIETSGSRLGGSWGCWTARAGPQERPFVTELNNRISQALLRHFDSSYLRSACRRARYTVS